MAGSSIAGVVIRGIASAVPEGTQRLKELTELLGGSDPEKIVEVTGIRSWHVSRPGQTTSDLCFAATETLLRKLSWDRDSVEALLFVSQTFDYIAPATSCCLLTPKNNKPKASSRQMTAKRLSSGPMLRRERAALAQNAAASTYAATTDQPQRSGLSQCGRQPRFAGQRVMGRVVG